MECETSASVSDLIDHFRLDAQHQGDCTLEIIRTAQPHGRRIIQSEKRWIKQGELGYGTFGEVWLEKNQKGEARAIKAIKKRKNPGIDYYKELLAMAKLSKHVQLFVEFFGWYENTESIFIAMEYLQHGDLHKHLNVVGACSEHDSKMIAYQLLEGLGVMHNLGFAHRDLKPQNIFITNPGPEWWIKIGDFGIAKRVRVNEETALRTEIGTRLYRAPEVDGLLDEDIDEYTNAVDIWSLGCVIYWTLTKEVPFHSINKLSEYVQRRGPFPTGSLQEKSISKEGMAFLEKALAVEPSERFDALGALNDRWLDGVNVDQVINDDADHLSDWSPESITLSSKQSVSTSATIDHWATNIFSNDMGSTPLPRSADVSKCYGMVIPDVIQRLAKDYNQVIQISFTRELIVTFYIRADDRQVVLALCRSTGDSASLEHCCLPLTSMIIRRPESSPCLQLCRRSSSGLELWANLKFSIIEKLVLFFCTFLALRGQDSGRPVSDITDLTLSGETEVYGGQIMDDNYLLALRILRDKSSKAVRLQAAVLRGEMKGIPVWTAFIHHRIVSQSWLKWHGTKTVLLADLKRHLFSDGYTPQRTPHGESVLNFTSLNDADDFVATIIELGAAYRRS